MIERWMHRGKFAPFIKAAQAWERKLLRTLKVDDLELDPVVGCPWCSEGRPHPRVTKETVGSGCTSVVRLCIEAVFVFVVLVDDIMDALHRR